MMLYVGLFILLVSLDMGAKQYIDDTFATGEEKPIGLGPVVLRKEYNHGYLMNFLHDYPQAVKAGSAAAAVILALYDGKLLLEKGRPLHKLGMTFLSAGAFSNIYDRLFRDALIDYIGISNVTANLADVYILFGSGLALVTQESHETAQKRRSKQVRRSVQKAQKRAQDAVQDLISPGTET